MKIIKATMIAFMCIFATTSFAQNCTKNPIFCAIKTLKPTIDNSRAMHFSNMIAKLSKQNGVNPYRAVAIIMQESSFESVNTFKVDRHEETQCTETSCVKTVMEKHVAFDLGLVQINVKTAISYGFDIERLFSLDEDYALECFFVILKDKKRMCNDLGSENWSCYHSATEKYRSDYAKRVNDYFKRINPDSAKVSSR